MTGITDLNEQIENLEPEVESAVEKKSELIEKEKELKAALNDLEHDLQIMSLAQKHLDITQNDYDRIEATLADYRDQVTEIQNELNEMIELTERSTGVIEDLSKLGIIADESIVILYDRKELIDKCSEQLQAVSNLLDLNYYLHMVKSVSVYSSEKNHEEVLKEDSSLSDSSQNQPETQQTVYSSWNGVLFQGSIDSNYSNILYNRINGAMPAARKVFEKYRSSLIVQDSSFTDGNHYKPYPYETYERGVYIDSFEDQYDERGRGVAFYHEMGHMIDHAANHFQSFLSESNTAFGRALREDGNKITGWYKSLDENGKTSFRRYLYNGKCNSLSDLIKPLSNKTIIGRFNHDDTYWQYPGAVEAEAFAHFFEAAMGHDPFLDEQKKDILQRFFPSAWNEFEKMLGHIGSE